ncbi:AMIN domain-containing protein [Altericista sp. CCNU0014]|uniref:AMIN domain-containing protein n=1 Tax=Altericista sp. CCNU0014 TaxID=3082949 RepID=UPI00384F7FB5
MNWDLKRYGFAFGTAALVAAVHLPARAAQTEITGAQLTPSGKGFELTLTTQGNNRPPIFTVNRGNSSVADISNAQLRLPSGQTFSQPKPAPGIESIEMRQLDANTVRITVLGSQSAPVSDTIRRDESQGLLVLRFNAVAVGEGVGPSANATPSSGQSPNAVPPFRSRAIAPPVGDIAVGAINSEADSVELNNAQIIPKLLLRNAPVREVLTLLGRSANVNVAFAEGESSSDPAKPGAGDSGSTISLDIENESVQDVFNYVLRLSGLQANKVGNTIFVGKNLPGDAQNRIVRTLRLNQLRASAKVTLTTELTSKSEIGGSISSTSATGTSSGSSASKSDSSINRLTSTSEEVTEKGAIEILESYGANNGGGGGQDGGVSADLLKGLQVVADARLNSVTLIGTPRKVAVATNIIQQLDLRRRQAAVNVKIVDINLLKGRNFDSSLSFNLNGANRFQSGPAGSIGNALGIVFGGGGGPVSITNIANSIVGSLIANVTNDNAKILTDPTLIVQEGSSAQVNLTTEVFSGFEQSSTPQSVPGSTAAAATVTVKPIIRQAGVIFNVAIDRIDDNGFISLNVSPEVSSIASEYSFVFPGTSDTQRGSLLNQRRLETGKVRLRDGQTLVLTGIIQDTDRATISKVPILGDIPLLGRLFRRETGTRARSELVVLVTPRVLDDSAQAGTGYQYSPSPDAQKLLEK